MTTLSCVTGLDPATGNGIAVEMSDGRIVAIRPEAAAERVYLSTGLVDLQVNGYGGLDLNAGAFGVDLVATLCHKLAATGVTTFLPTLITASPAALIEGLETLALARKAHPLVASMVPGAHIEGPHISPLDGPRGAHRLEYVRPPSIAEFQRWQTASDGRVKLVTLAPEHAGTVDYVTAVTAAGVHVAIGHTAATPDQVHTAAAAGARLSTHLGNAVALQLPRHPNMVWAQLADDRLTASFIADTHHLPADTFKAMLRAKSLQRAILVSDSVALAGMPPGRYEQPIGGDVEVGADGRVGIADTPYLAGAGLPLSAGVARAVMMAGLTLAEALSLATVNPGRFAGGRGVLAVGQRADLMRFAWTVGDRDLSVCDTWVAGVAVKPR